MDKNKSNLTFIYLFYLEKQTITIYTRICPISFFLFVIMTGYYRFRRRLKVPSDIFIFFF